MNIGELTDKEWGELMGALKEDQKNLEAQGAIPIDLTLDESEEDWFAGLTCNPDAPEECESCQ